MPDVSDLLLELNDHGFDAVSDTRKLGVLNATYWDACGREPWPFLEKFARLTFSGTSYEPSGSGPQPADFHAATSVKLEGIGGYPIPWARRDVFDNAFGDNTIIATGNPTMFTITGDGLLHFFPAPASNQVVRLGYISTPTALLANTLEAAIAIPKQFQRDLLINGAVYRLMAQEDDTDISPVFLTFYENALTNMRDWMWRQQYVQPDIVHPVSMDDLGLDEPFGWGGTP